MSNHFKSLKPHTSCSISAISGDPVLVTRLQELGLSQGAEVIYVGKISLGGPRIFQFGATLLALREEESNCLELLAI